MQDDTLPDEHEDERDDDFDDDDGDDAPTKDELALLRTATADDAAAVDAMILAGCTTRWSKVAMVAGRALDAFEAKVPHLPFVYLQVRMQALADAGVVELAGNVMSMRRSEIRLAAGGAA